MNDSSKRAEGLGLTALVLAAVLLVFTSFLGLRSFHSRILLAAGFPLAAAMVYALVAWWRSFLVRREAEEALEEQRVREEYDREDLFTDQEEALRLAAHARQSFDRYFVPAFALVSGLLLAIIAVLAWHYWNINPTFGEPRAALGAAGLSFFMMIFCLLAGSYFNGASREPAYRWVRAAGQWLLCSAPVFLLALATMLLEHYRKIVQWDLKSGKIVLAFMIVFGIELIVNFVIEFYRPRQTGEERRPLHESRLLALVTEPGGIARNVAQALDYQFGFEVSETWFYRFLERAVIPVIVILVLALYSLDCFVVVATDHVGLKERFGKPVADKQCQPGLYLKWPWPIERIRQFPAKQIQIVRIGYEELSHEEQHQASSGDGGPTAGDPSGKIILWDKTHYKEETRFLVATASQTQAAPEVPDEGTPAKGGTVPVNFLSTSIPVHYRVADDGLADYAYNYSDSVHALEDLAAREVVRFFASADFIDLISAGQYRAREELERRITEAVTNAEPSLGVEIVFVGMMGAHPPHDVAKAYQQVIAAHEESATKVLEAEQYSLRTQNEAAAKREQILWEAKSYRYGKETVSGSEAERFNQQYNAYRIAPRVFKMRARLAMLAEIAGSVRKYIISDSILRSPGGSEIINLNFEEKAKFGVSDIDLEAVSRDAAQ